MTRCYRDWIRRRWAVVVERTDRGLGARIEMQQVAGRQSKALRVGVLLALLVGLGAWAWQAEVEPTAFPPAGLPRRLAARRETRKPAQETPVETAEAHESTSTERSSELDTVAADVAASLATDARPRVRLVTSLGDVVIELDADAAPATVENFLRYVDAGSYDGTIFHQVVAGKMALAGGFTSGEEAIETGEEIVNEADQGRANVRGTVAMARQYDRAHSSTSQFFFNLADNPKLDHRSNMPEEFGYCVFGDVVAGMEVLDRIGASETRTTARFELLPVPSIVLIEARRESAAAARQETSRIARGEAMVESQRPPRETR